MSKSMKIPETEKYNTIAFLATFASKVYLFQWYKRIALIIAKIPNITAKPSHSTEGVKNSFA
jgi:hypothetical protein